MPQMYRSPSYETNSPNPFFADSMSSRQPVNGTIPRGFKPYAYPNTTEGYEAAGSNLKNPFPSTEENLAEGKRLFDIFCVHCHGAEGKGDGMMVQNGKFPPPPSYSGPLKDLSVGKMFHTLQYGKNMMGSHASQLDSDERWKIITYVQKLQQLASATVAATDSTTKTK
jgi:mono/diheme cytochrome c family protein